MCEKQLTLIPGVVNVGVNESGNDEFPRSVDDLDTCRRRPRSVAARDLLDHAILDQDASVRDGASARSVDQCSPFYKERLGIGARQSAQEQEQCETDSATHTKLLRHH